MKIIIDADACPVKHCVIELAFQKKVPVLMVCSVSHQLPEYPNVVIKQVDNYPQAADVAIVNKVQPGDIVVTSDGGLAAIVLSRQAHALSFHGKEYHPDEIDAVLNERHLTWKFRRSGGKTRGPKPFTHKDEERFISTLTRMMGYLI